MNRKIVRRSIYIKKKPNEYDTSKHKTMKELSRKDKTYVCGECGKTFLFTEREQAFYAQNNWSRPRYCKECRPLMRARRAKDNDPEYSKKYKGLTGSRFRDGVDSRSTKAREVNLHAGNSPDKRK